MTTNTDMTMTETNVVARLLEGIRAGDVSADLYADDATWDGVVPGWRFGLRGAAAITAEYARWFDVPGEVEEVRRQSTPAGEVLEYTRVWVEDGIPHASRHVHVLTVDPVGGRIVDDRLWCGGRWAAALLAEMEAAG